MLADIQVSHFAYWAHILDILLLSIHHFKYLHDFSVIIIIIIIIMTLFKEEAQLA